MPRPDNATYDSVAGWLESELDRAAAAHVNPGRHRQPASSESHRIRKRRARPDRGRSRCARRCCRRTNRRSDSTPTPTRFRCSRRCWIDTYPRRPRLPAQAVGDPNMPPAFVRYGAIKNNSNELTYLWQTERLGEDFPLGIARRDRRAPLFSGRRRICFQASAAAGLGERDPRPERAESVRNSRGREARRRNSRSVAEPAAKTKCARRLIRRRFFCTTAMRRCRCASR